MAFRLSEPDGPGRWKNYFGAYAGYRGSAWSVTILPQAIHWGGGALEVLRDIGPAVRVAACERRMGLRLRVGRRVAEHRGAVLEFVSAVVANRSNGDDPDS